MRYEDTEVEIMRICDGEVIVVNTRLDSCLNNERGIDEQ
jgi:hypothetical protein